MRAIVADGAGRVLTVVPPAIDRISQIGGQMTGNPTAGGKERILEKRPDDVRNLLPASSRRIA